MCRQSATVCLTKSPSPRQRELPGVAERLATLPDPRDRRGRRHSLVSVLLTAVLSGARSYLAIGQWAHSAPQDALARLGVRPRGPLGLRSAPATSTIRRVLTSVCPGGLADLLGAATAGAGQVAVDGKSARGSRTGTDDAVHLLWAVTGSGRVISQLPVPGKTTEVTALPALLAPFDLTGVTVTADALHTWLRQASYHPFTHPLDLLGLT
ncbi:transposase family protein [Streptomyces sp. NPDC102270]|uniref:transposase family protein n=1 Tax=Streptomyces sp. NPDC102270 TaxID=3366150 RepID=UPI0038263EDE